MNDAMQNIEERAKDEIRARLDKVLEVARDGNVDPVWVAGMMTMMQIAIATAKFDLERAKG